MSDTVLYRVLADRKYSQSTRCAHGSIELIYTYSVDLTRYHPGYMGYRSTGGDCLMKITWQTDTDNKSWYAFRIESDNLADPERLKLIAGLVRRLLSILDANEETKRDPLSVVAALDRMKIPRIVYDTRVSDYVTPDQLAGDEWLHYQDDSRSLGERYNHCGVLARNEDEARQRIAAHMAANNRLGLLSRWLAGDSPVTCQHYRGGWNNGDKPAEWNRTPAEWFDIETIE